MLIAPSTLLLFFLPLSPTVGYNLYIGVSLLVQAAIRYGGCEVLGIPTLFLRRRYAVYCVFNATDVVELLLTMAVLAIAVTVGDGDGERVLYLLFLVVGFIVDKVRTRAR